MHRADASESGAARWHLLALLLLAVGFEALFIHHGIDWFDEAWPLYAARRLHEGGTLYRDTFFLFPPGHLLAAWIGHAVDPPGIVLSRWIYAGFTVAAVLALYALSRRLMPARFAFLAAALLAVAAPASHHLHLLFGWRYVVFGVLGLLAFARFLDTERRVFMGLAGACCGVMADFRLAPAFATVCGIAVATLVARGRGRRWLLDGAAGAAGFALAVLPVLAWIALGAGLPAAWNEAVVRLLGLQSAQSLPLPPLELPARFDRALVTELFVAVQVRAYPLLALAHLVALGFHRARHRRDPWPHALLLAVSVWAGVLLVRIGGRADDHHLYSSLPPQCVLVAHALWQGFALLAARVASARLRDHAGLALCIGFFALWVFLMRSDEYLDVKTRGRVGVKAAGDARIFATPVQAFDIDRKIALVRRFSRPDDIILNLSLTTVSHVLADRTGPGYFDVVMPGTFRDATEEEGFLARLRSAPPAVVLFPMRPFDEMPSRSLEATAPRIARWVKSNYRAAEPLGDGFIVMVPARARPGKGAQPRAPGRR